jgi:hypothetical protein
VLEYDIERRNSQIVEKYLGRLERKKRQEYDFSNHIKPGFRIPQRRSAPLLTPEIPFCVKAIDMIGQIFGEWTDKTTTKHNR